MTQQNPYSYATLAQARQQLSQRLYDSPATFWSVPELNAYIVEGLRTWNALTANWRGDFVFPTLNMTTAPVSATYTFNLPNQYPLPAPWVINPTYPTGLQILGGVALAHDLSNEASELYTGIPNATDQSSTVTIGNIVSDGAIFAEVRSGPVGEYTALVNGPLGAGVTVFLDNSPTVGLDITLGSFTGTVNPGDMLGLNVTGNVLTVTLNGIVIITATDNTYTTGGFGMGIDPGTGLITDTSIGGWAGTMTVPTAGGGQSWFDLTQVPNTLRPYTVLDTDLYAIICYHLLEPVTGPVSLQYTQDDILNAVQRRRDETLSETACTQTRINVPAVAGRITLPDQVIDVRRMAYFPTQAFDPAFGYGSGRYGFGLYGVSQVPYVQLPGPTVVWPEDTWAEQSFDILFPLNPAGVPGTPSTYLLTTQPPLSFDTNAPPAFAGSYELLVTQAGPALSLAMAQTLSVPDDFTHVIKWGALADLFNRESNAKDLLRANYCEQRYRLGLALLNDAPALLAMRIGNVPVQVNSVRSGDLYDTFWETTVQGPPTKVHYSGLNLVAFSPVPDAGTYSITVQVVENAPIPVADTDFIQIARSDYDALLDYCVHIAALKMGGAEFNATMPLYERFLSQARLYNRKLDEIAEFKSTLYHLSQREKAFNPVTTPEEESTSAG